MAFGIYALALRFVLRQAQDGATLRVVLTFALLFRLTLVFVQGHPYLPDQDAYRYLWDGRVTSAGMNPYRFSPKEISDFMSGDRRTERTDEERRTLRRLTELAREPAMRGVFESVGHREVRTIYPPASQLLFAAAACLRPGSFITYKILLLLVEAAAIPALLGLLRKTGRDPSAVIVYAWSPLVILEFSYAGHQDVLAVASMILGLAASSAGRPWRSGAMVGLGILGKLFPAALLGIFFRWTGRRCILAAAGVVILLTLPFAGAGSGLLSGAGVYATTWKWNAGFFALLENVLLLATPHPSAVARILVGGIVIGAMALLARRPVAGTEDAARRALVVLS
ncbi:MAG: DUF2029 domain-containing protein, partial [Acidobacteria bacterium]|nr:DUF2029 domain-containing protein [Acidobacteriota bacterium]